MKYETGISYFTIFPRTKNAGNNQEERLHHETQINRKGWTQHEIPFDRKRHFTFQDERNWMRWFTIPVGALISAAIEYTQLVTGRGYCQLDDFVTNTAGAAIGFFIYLILYAGWLVWKKIR